MWKVLDVSRPLLFLRGKISEKEEFRGSKMANEVNTALRLWGHTFHGIAASPAHRNFEDFGPQICVASKKTKPFQDSLVYPHSLFERTFIEGMMKEARDHTQLKIVSRGSVPASSQGPGNDNSARETSKCFRRSSQSRVRLICFLNRFRFG